MRFCQNINYEMNCIIKLIKINNNNNQIKRNNKSLSNRKISYRLINKKKIIFNNLKAFETWMNLLYKSKPYRFQ